MGSIPSDRLVRLLNLLEKNIRAAEKMSLVGDPVSTFCNDYLIFFICHFLAISQRLPTSSYLKILRLKIEVLLRSIRSLGTSLHYTIKYYDLMQSMLPTEFVKKMK